MNKKILFVTSFALLALGKIHAATPSYEVVCHNLASESDKPLSLTITKAKSDQEGRFASLVHGENKAMTQRIWVLERNLLKTKSSALPTTVLYDDYAFGVSTFALEIDTSLPNKDSIYRGKLRIDDQSTSSEQDNLTYYQEQIVECHLYN